MVKRRGLGRGLDALLGSAVSREILDAVPERQLRNLPVEVLKRGRFQPRLEIDPVALEELTSSVRSQGVVQPIVVRPLADGMHYEIVAGERRWRAAQAAGLAEIPAVVREVSDEEALAIGLIENIQREDLNPVEEARALRRLIDEFGMTHGQAAEAVGRSRAGVTNILRLLELNTDVRALLEQGQLEMGHARALLGLSGELQYRAALEVVSKGLSARETERLVRGYKGAEARPERTPARADPDVARLEQEVGERLGAPVKIRYSNKGKGTLTIRYTSLEELDGILERIK